MSALDDDPRASAKLAALIESRRFWREQCEKTTSWLSERDAIIDEQAKRIAELEAALDKAIDFYETDVSTSGDCACPGCSFIREARALLNPSPKA